MPAAADRRRRGSSRRLRGRASGPDCRVAGRTRARRQRRAAGPGSAPRAAGGRSTRHSWRCPARRRSTRQTASGSIRPAQTPAGPRHRALHGRSTAACVHDPGCQSPIVLRRTDCAMSPSVRQFCAPPGTLSGRSRLVASDLHCLPLPLPSALNSEPCLTKVIRSADDSPILIHRQPMIPAPRPFLRGRAARLALDDVPPPALLRLRRARLVTRPDCPQHLGQRCCAIALAGAAGRAYASSNSIHAKSATAAMPRSNSNHQVSGCGRRPAPHRDEHAPQHGEPVIVPTLLPCVGRHASGVQRVVVALHQAALELRPPLRAPHQRQRIRQIHRADRDLPPIPVDEDRILVVGSWGKSTFPIWASP